MELFLNPNVLFDAFDIFIGFLDILSNPHDLVPQL